MKESKRSSLDDDDDDDDDNDDYDCSSSPTPGPPKSTTATEPSPPPKEEPEEEPKCSKLKPIPQPDPKLKQEPVNEPKEDEDELEPLPPLLIPEINHELAAAKSIPLNKPIAQLDTVELVASGRAQPVGVIRIQVPLLLLDCNLCKHTRQHPPPPHAPVVSEPPHVVHIDASAPQEGPQVICVTSPPAPAPAPVVAAPVISEPPLVIRIGGSAPQEGPQVIRVTSPPVPAPVVAAPATSEPPNVICIGDSTPQEGPQVIHVIHVTSPQPIVAPAPPVPAPQVICVTTPCVEPVPSAPASINPASTQLTIMHLGPFKPIQPQIIHITSAKPEPAPAPAPSEPPHIICIGMSSRPEQPPQIIRITSATPKLPQIILLISFMLPHQVQLPPSGTAPSALSGLSHIIITQPHHTHPPTSILQPGNYTPTPGRCITHPDEGTQLGYPPSSPGTVVSQHGNTTIPDILPSDSASQHPGNYDSGPTPILAVPGGSVASGSTHSRHSDSIILPPGSIHHHPTVVHTPRSTVSSQSNHTSVLELERQAQHQAEDEARQCQIRDEDKEHCRRIIAKDEEHYPHIQAEDKECMQ
ncbi:hypothetical protein FRC11_012432 [Ceratobasidium sp. 423]|nr:hypothetical protein FRC11_012432 [Ceratobasidium sp. 423]